MFNYRNNSTQGGFMGNAGGLVGGLTNMALQQPFQGLVGMGMDAMAPDNTSFYRGPQFGQVDQYPASAAGFLNKRVFS